MYRYAHVPSYRYHAVIHRLIEYAVKTIHIHIDVITWHYAYWANLFMVFFFTNKTRSIARFHLLDVFQNNRRDDDIQKSRVDCEIHWTEKGDEILFTPFSMHSNHKVREKPSTHLLCIIAKFSTVHLRHFFFSLMLFVRLDSPTFFVSSSLFGCNLLLLGNTFSFSTLEYTVKQRYKSAFCLYIYFIEFKISKIIFNLLVDWEGERGEKKIMIYTATNQLLVRKPN